ncbi:hypothetical protein MKW98_008128 [Papaver atlanticum]|uniref:Uncharacterized protein n=1 Tax=Papaver atlanticum TaxID=357466 RepID=A0AAD4S9G0_9MAGN|nr:hypothetical protein MKW98_008128 [Papaver atlanticum]
MKSYDVGGTSLSLALYKDVTNSKELLNLMHAGTLEPEVAFLNASLIPDLVFNYSGSKHITESLKRCGISETTTYVLAAQFASPDETSL